MTVENATIVVRSESVLGTEVDGEFVLIEIESGQYFGLDAIGSAIWRGVESPRGVGDLCADLQAEFDGDPAVIQRETLDFVTTLLASGLLVRSETMTA